MTMIATGLEADGHVVRNNQYFDTLKIKPSIPVEDIKARAEAQEINFRYFPDGDVSMSSRLLTFWLVNVTLFLGWHLN